MEELNLFQQILNLFQQILKETATFLRIRNNKCDRSNQSYILHYRKISSLITYTFICQNHADRLYLI